MDMERWIQDANEEVLRRWNEAELVLEGGRRPLICRMHDFLPIANNGYRPSEEENHTMCTSIIALADAFELTERFRLDRIIAHTSDRYEIAPTEHLSGIVVRNNERVLDDFRWGLMPFWAKDSVFSDCTAMLEKRAFHYIVKKQRCVIPCTGYYVTERREGGDRPVRVTLHERAVFAVAGLFDVWESSYSGEELRTCTLLTISANRAVSAYQEWMPLILKDEDIDRWLDPGVRNPDPDLLSVLFHRVEAERMRLSPIERDEDKRGIPTWEEELPPVPPKYA